MIVVGMEYQEVNGDPDARSVRHHEERIFLPLGVEIGRKQPNSASLPHRAIKKGRRPVRF